MPLVQIVVAAGCSGCQEARRLADEAQRRFPAATVEVIDLEAEPRRRPASVFAVPTYLLDGRVISLGTPSDAEFYHWIEERLTGPVQLVAEEKTE